MILYASIAGADVVHRGAVTIENFFRSIDVPLLLQAIFYPKRMPSFLRLSLLEHSGSHIAQRW